MLLQPVKTQTRTRISLSLQEDWNMLMFTPVLKEETQQHNVKRKRHM